ncbi:MAG: NAD(P)/FAD-dependent oxidoreductase [Thermoleophilia bacterium]|nr:NAD(P)/FAD-dependent oxidoreductase [Thermoleophilia bacterium]MDH4339994.1 NAD(P)/FAD-dependent oxidoreductase [Thermoleophilia bacterium]
MAKAAEQFETVIIGGGQAGLATAYHLARRDRSCLVLDAGERVGDSWRTRWPSLHLYTPARYDGLPGMAFPAARHSFPSGHEMGDYLETYAERFALPVRTGVHVRSLSREGERFVLTAGEQRIEAHNVVVATGVMQRPAVPEFASELDSGIRQLHSSEYQDPSQLQDGAVLVVGASHSGADIAFEVAGEHRTVLSGPSTGQFPFSIESRRARAMLPVLKVLATRVLTMNTPIGRKVRSEIRSHGGPLLRVRSADLAAAGVERVLARTVGVEDGMPVLDDGRVVEAANVIWCIGFRPDYSWIDLPLEYEDAFPRQSRGAVPSMPGLYFIGMLFLHSFSSMLVLGAGRDAKRIAESIVSRGAPAAREEGVLVWNGKVSAPTRRFDANTAEHLAKAPASRT